MENENIKRVRYFESLFNEANEVIKNLEKSLQEYDKCLPKIKELDAYLDSKERWDDLVAEEKGIIPNDMPRGVLGEDYLYDMLGTYHKIKKRIK